ncbi:MAG: APC family permease [Spirochaetales bacterium]
MVKNNETGSLGLFSCIAIIVGAMVGSAIFSLSGLTVFLAGPSAILSWIIAAVIMLLYGLCIAELATLFPKSGGVFVFPSKALGKTEKVGALWGWVSTWGYINANIVAIAFSAIYVATYLSAAFGIFSDMQVPTAIVAIVLCFGLNTLRVSVTGKINAVLVFCLVIALGIFIGVTLFSGEWNSDMLKPFFSQGNNGVTGFLGAVPTAMVGYGSIVAIAFMVSEVKNPNKNVPSSMIVAMIIVVLIYASVIFAVTGLVSADFLQENPHMRFIPLYAACFTKLAEYPWLTGIVSVAAVLALLTTMLVVMSLTGRAIQASAEKKILPEIFTKNGKTNTPIYATALPAVFAIIVSCFPEFTQEIVGFGALFAAVTMVIHFASLISARKKIQYQPGTFKAFGGNVVPVLACTLIAICYIPDILSGGWIIWAYSVLWYMVGLLVFKFSKANSELQ